MLKGVRSCKLGHETLMRDEIGGARAALRDAVATLGLIDGQEVQLAQARFDLAELDHGQLCAAGIKRLFSTQRTTQKWSPIKVRRAQLSWRADEAQHRVACWVAPTPQPRNLGVPRGWNDGHEGLGRLT